MDCKILLTACKDGQLDVVKYLVSCNADIRVNNNEPLRWEEVPWRFDFLHVKHFVK